MPRCVEARPWGHRPWCIKQTPVEEDTNRHGDNFSWWNNKTH